MQRHASFYMHKVVSLPPARARAWLRSRRRWRRERELVVSGPGLPTLDRFHFLSALERLLASNLLDPSSVRGIIVRLRDLRACMATGWRTYLRASRFSCPITRASIRALRKKAIEVSTQIPHMENEEVRRRLTCADSRRRLDAACRRLEGSMRILLLPSRPRVRSPTCRRCPVRKDRVQAGQSVRRTMPRAE